MLFYENLEEIIFHRHELFASDELVVLSGYLGPSPVSRLESLPIKSSVIYGMYGSDGIRERLHTALLDLNKKMDNTTILYSNIPVHSKCYIWKKQDLIVHALIGSANFSTSGLSNPYKEVLAETTYDTFSPLNAYLKMIIDKSISCDEHVPTSYTKKIVSTGTGVPLFGKMDICNISFLDRNNEVPEKSGLNWGHGNGNVKPNDAYIPININHIFSYPNLFPPKQIKPMSLVRNGRMQRHNDSVEIIWDDGVVMEGLLEGSQEIGGITYPKQISSSSEKSIIGAYIRKRIGLPSGSKVSKTDLERYGRTNIDISLQSEGVYFFDFSIN